MVRFVLIVSVLLSVMVAPDRLGSNVMTAPLGALVMADRSVPGPLSALLVTTCAEAGAASSSKLKRTGNVVFMAFLVFIIQQSEIQPARCRAPAPIQPR